MEKIILIFGAGRSSGSLIQYLIKQADTLNWKIIVADNDLELARDKIGSSARANAVKINVRDDASRRELIKPADIIISLLPADLHFIVAKDCLEYSKNLLTASYLDENMSTLSRAVKEKGLLFLCEMGLDPGIDHMSAMKILDEIKNRKGSVISFMSHCGGLVAPGSDNNPWHYKISWNSANVVKAGSAGAIYLQDGKEIFQSYDSLFANHGMIKVPGLGDLAYYPNRDSLSYRDAYELQNTETFVRTTLRYPEFCKAWQALISAGLTQEQVITHSQNMTFKQWSEPIQPFVSDENRLQLEFLGLFSEQSIPTHLNSSFAILKYLLESHLNLEEFDKDMVVMLHEVRYMLDEKIFQVRSYLVVEGIDSRDTAMARTVGLPLGIAAKLILTGKIMLTGLHIPIKPEIYEPVLRELKEHRIEFTEVVE